MAEHSAIEWTDHTHNEWIGCERISPACDHCYAATQDAFRKWTPEGWGGPRKLTSVANRAKPLRWNSQPWAECSACHWRGEMAAGAVLSGPGCDVPRCPRCSGELQPARARVFCSSLSDVFDNAVDPAWRVRLFDTILATPNLDWLLLTKRIGNAQRMIDDAIAGLRANGMNPPPWPWQNVWLGATIANQEEAGRDIWKLARIPAVVRFLSMEPLLSAVNLTELHRAVRGGGGMAENALTKQPYGRAMVDWVIVGGESGNEPRPMHPQWVRDLRDQCERYGTAFLFKQWGEWAPTELEAASRGGLPPVDRPINGNEIAGTKVMLANGREALWPMVRIGKKAAGRTLDGKIHSGYPTPKVRRSAASS